MTIIKVLNNNIILVENEIGDNQIIWGKGVGFNKHIGDCFSPSSEDELFVREADSEWGRTFRSLSETVPIEYFEVTKKIIQTAEKNLNVSFNPFLLITLADHIFFAIKRSEKTLISGPVLSDIERNYPQEYAEAVKSVHFIEQCFTVLLEDNEIAFIAIHFVENEVSNNEENTLGHINEAKLIKEIFQLITEKTQLNLMEKKNIDRLKTHLKFLCRRIAENEHFTDSRDDEQLYQNLKNNFPEYAKCTELVADFLIKNYKFELSISEKIYLLMHFQQVGKHR